MATTTLRKSKTSVQTASALDLIAGLWLILSPFILGYSNLASALWNSLIIGFAVIVFGGMRAGSEGYKTLWPSWANFILGIWLIVSPYLLGFSNLSALATRNTIILGIIVAILAVWGALSTPAEATDQDTAP